MTDLPAGYRLLNDQEIAEAERHEQKIREQIEQYDREKALHMSQRELKRLLIAGRIERGEVINE